MSATNQPGLVRRGLRKLLPGRTVEIEVQGVHLKMPWHHRLPDYARSFPQYGQNLVDLARLLGEHGPIQMVDVGANLGDSTLQVANATELRSLCIEGDPYWLRFLSKNLAGDNRFHIEPALLVAKPEEADDDKSPVRHLGTTHFERSDRHAGLARVLVSDLPGRHPEFDKVRLIKSDTDGYDVGLIPALARAWSTTRPVLFFEYDPGLSRQAGSTDPDRVWDELAELGYRTVVVWDNFGNFRHLTTVVEARSLAQSLDPPLDPTCLYWDVAVVHSDDAEADQVLSTLADGGIGSAE